MSDSKPSGKKLTLEDVAEKIKSGEVKNVVFMVGAGISTNSGIPDFRSPGTGLYDNLQRLNLPYPEAIFDLDYFIKNPKPFYTLADELYPGKFKPTKFHHFMKLIEEKGLLRRVYTQNIDTLERIAGLNEEKIIEAHGSFAANRCIDCKTEMSADELKKTVWAEKGKIVIPKCKNPKCKRKKGGIIKPDIVFFGEGLPSKFFTSIPKDIPTADLVIVAGTSLTVSPFSQLPEMASKDCVRVLFNTEKVGTFGLRKNDILALGDCDEHAEELATLCGWAIIAADAEDENENDGGKIECKENSAKESEEAAKPLVDKLSTLVSELALEEK